MQQAPYAYPLQAERSIDPNNPFTAIAHLGPMQSEHGPTAGSRWVGIVLGALSMLGAGICTLVAGFGVLEQLSRRRPDIAGALIGPLIGIGICLPLAALFFWIAWRNWPRKAALYQGGFAYFDRKGLKAVRWEDIETAFQHVVRQYVNGVYTGTYYTYTIFPRGQDKIVLDNRFKNIESLGNTIIKSSAIALLPRYTQALQAGQRLTFGPLAIDLQGIYSGSKSLSWNEIKAVKLDRGILSVAKEGKWLNWTSATVPQIPNFYVLMALLDKVTVVQ